MPKSKPTELTEPTETTIYSLKIEGEPPNYNWPVSFDITDGFVGIDQYKDYAERRTIDRVLLSPTQMQELIAFVKRRRHNR